MRRTLQIVALLSTGVCAFTVPVGAHQVCFQDPGAPRACYEAPDTPPNRAQVERDGAAAERKNADDADQAGMDALNRGDWDEALNRFADALRHAPGDDAIREHLNRAKAGAADSESAAQITLLDHKIQDAFEAADIEKLRQRFHVEEVKLAIPTVCLIADQLKSNANCDVLEAAGLGWDLAGANGHREMLHILLDEAAHKVVFMSFPPELSLESRIAFIRATYEYEKKEFSGLISKIQQAMRKDELAAKLRTEYAIRDSAAVVALRQSVADESRRNTEAATRFLLGHSESTGIAFRCDLACHQLIGAAKGINVID